MPETKILQNQSPDPETQLGQLSDSLRTLLATIKAGEWERFADLAEKLTPVMDAVHSAAGHRQFNSREQRQKIEAILAMLESAIHDCSTRKDQLSPLIDALNRASARSSPP